MIIPSFNEKKRFVTQINKASQVITVNDATRQLFDTYRLHFEGDGFVAVEERESEKVAFVALKKEEYGVFINYYFAVNSLTVVIEKDGSSVSATYSLAKYIANQGEDLAKALYSYSLAAAEYKLVD